MSFALKKIPVLFLFSGLHADYHRPTDRADKINYRGLEESVDFAADLVRGMAEMDRQQYVDAADASPMRIGGVHGDGKGAGGGSRVTLGVVPDYSSFGQGGGVRISGTSPGSPADAAGLKAGDVIVKMGDRNIDTLYDLSDALAAAKPGQKVKLKVVRQGAKEPLEMEATLAERKG
jgi:S1-C subfamily serine protease